MADIIMCTLGTRGDILPFVALGRELQGRGHSVTVLSNKNWQQLVTDHGLGFLSIAPQDPSQSGRDDYRFFVDNTLPSFSRSFDFVAHRVRAAQDTILVYRSNMLGMECAAERFGLRHIKIALQPCSIRSFERPPWPLTPLATGQFRKIFKAIVIPALYTMAETTRRYRKHTDAFRRAIGVARRTRAGAPGTEDATLVFAPPWYAIPQTDWPRNCHCVGFPFLDAFMEDAGIAEFHARYGAPLVFTPGTGVVDTKAFFTKAEAVCARLNMAAVFLGRNAKASAPNILAREFVDMAWLLQRTRLIVHHGGIGTTAQALRAGVPQVILPDRFDQPDNAQRVARLGLGAAVMKDIYSPEHWADLIRELLESNVVRQRLGKVSADVRRNLAAAKAANVIDSVLSNTATQPFRKAI